MTNKELLEQVAFLKARIEFLESLLALRPDVIRPQWTSSDSCIDYNGHDYTNPWFGTIPPNCKKCGRQAPGTRITITSSDLVKIHS